MVWPIIFTTKVLNAFMKYGILRASLSLHGMNTHDKVNLTLSHDKDWIMLTTKILSQLCFFLEEDLEITHLGQWLGLYSDGVLIRFWY